MNNVTVEAHKNDYWCACSKNKKNNLSVMARIAGFS